MALLGIEKVLQDHQKEGGRNFFETYSVLKTRLLDHEYTQTMSEFPGANDHGPGHIRRLLKKLDEILGDKPLEHVNEFELWVAMVAALYHDVGLLQARDKHPEIGADLMLAETNSYIFDKHERDLIHTAIHSHSSRSDIEQKCRKYPKKYKIGDYSANAPLICALVRLADELDEDYRRGDEELFRKRKIAERYPDSVKFWRFNQRIPAVCIDVPNTNHRELQFQLAFEPEDASFVVNDESQSTSFPAFAVRKLLKINTERLICNKFFPEPLRFSHMTITLLPTRESPWDVPKEVRVNEQSVVSDILAQFPDDLRPAPPPVVVSRPPESAPVAASSNPILLLETVAGSPERDTPSPPSAIPYSPGSAGLLPAPSESSDDSIPEKKKAPLS